MFLNMAVLRRPATDTASSWPEWVVHESRNRKLVFAVRLNVMPHDVEMSVMRECEERGGKGAMALFQAGYGMRERGRFYSVLATLEPTRGILEDLLAG